jgi:hypothetical protein
MRNYQLMRDEKSSEMYAQKSIPVSISFSEFENRLKKFIMKHSDNDNILFRYQPMVMDVTPRSKKIDIIFQKGQINRKSTFEKQSDRYIIELYSDITEDISLDILKSKNLDGVIIHKNRRIELILKLKTRSLNKRKNASIFYRFLYRIKKCSGLILIGDFISIFRLISQISR